MNDAPRNPTGETTAQRSADAARWPVLARLSDVSTGSSIPRAANQTALGGTNYRFDPPQAADPQGQSAIYKDIHRDSGAAEVHSDSNTLRRHQPHVFERGRAADRKDMSRRESSVLPSSNPFTNPRPRLVDSLAPIVRFATMVVLFTAAATWFQVKGRHGTPTVELMELPKTAAQETIAPTSNASDRPVPAPTSAGPLETNPQSGTRVGRAEGDDFATSKQSSNTSYPAVHPSVSPPHFLVAGRERLPQVQTAELPKFESESLGKPSPADAPASGAASAEEGNADENPAVARYPGFDIENPTR